jgi:hypothetical protein
VMCEVDYVFLGSIRLQSIPGVCANAKGAGGPLGIASFFVELTGIEPAASRVRCSRWESSAAKSTRTSCPQRPAGTANDRSAGRTVPGPSLTGTPSGPC